MPRLAVTVRIDPRRVWMLAMLCGAAAVQGAVRLEVDDPEGWTHLRIEVDWPDEAANRLVGLGGVAEVLEPTAVRREVAELARASLARNAAAIWNSSSS